MSNKKKILAALKRKKFESGGRGGGNEGSELLIDDPNKNDGAGSNPVTPLDPLVIADPAANIIKAQAPTPFKIAPDVARKLILDPNAISKNEAIEKLDTEGDAVDTKSPVATEAMTTTAGIQTEAKDPDYGLPQGFSRTPPFFPGPTLTTDSPAMGPVQYPSYGDANEVGALVGTLGGTGYGEYPLGTAGPRVDPTDSPAKGKIFVYDKITGVRKQIDEPGAETYTADQVAESDFVTAKGAESDAVLTKAEAAQASLTERAKAAARDSFEETLAKGTAAQRPITIDKAVAATDGPTSVVGDVTEPEVERRDGITITDEERDELRKIAQGRGVALEDLQEYQDLVTTKQRQVQQGTAAQEDYTPRLGETPEATAARAETYGADYTPQGGETEIDAIPAYAKAAERVAAVGEAAQRKASELGTAPSTDLEGREAITGIAPQGDASQIGGIPTFEAAKMDVVQGKDRKVAAADMLAVVADLPEEVTAAISEDPATVQAQLDEDADPQVTAAVAALPQEALVSVQMENLLAGMEDGETPAWARPAVAAIEQ